MMCQSCPVVLWLVNTGYGGGGVLTLGPCNIASQREDMNNREKVDVGGGGKEGSNVAVVHAVSRFGRMGCQTENWYIYQYLIFDLNNALMAQLALVLVGFLCSHVQFMHSAFFIFPLI